MSARTCQDARRELFDETGDPRDGPREAHSHLATCPACRELLAELDGLLTAAEELAQTPLGDDVRRQVERSLDPAIQEAARRQRRNPLVALATNRWSWAAALGAAGAVALFILLPRSSSPSARLVLRYGEVRSATAGPDLRVGGRVSTGKESRAVVELASDRVVLLEETSLRLEHDRLVVERGSVGLRVESRASERERFTMRAGDTEITVIGTVFRVSQTRTRTEVSVAEGRVRVAVADRSLEINPGERAIVEGTALHRVEADDSELEWLSRVVESHSVGALARESAGPEPEPAPPVLPSPTAPRTTRQKPATEKQVPLNIRRKELLAAARAGECATAESLAMNLLSDARRPASSEALGVAADCFSGQGDLAAAQRLYRTIAKRFHDLPVGGNATYEVGRIARELGATGEAKRAFQTVVREYPRSPLASEALFSLCALRIDERDADGSVECLRRYRRKHPKGAHVAQSLLLEATVLRTVAGDCAGALVAYEAYLNNPGPYARQARSWSQWCREQIEPGNQP